MLKSVMHNDEQASSNGVLFPQAVYCTHDFVHKWHGWLSLFLGIGTFREHSSLDNIDSLDVFLISGHIREL